MNTNRLSLFDSPLFLGFDHFEETFDRLRKHAKEGYPPYNIEQTGENNLRITLAVAGFSMDDLDVEVEHNQLMIRGQQPDDQHERYFLLRVPRFEPDPHANPAAHETEALEAFGWWTATAMEASGEQFIPRALARYLPPLHSGDLPRQPLDVGL